VLLVAVELSTKESVRKKEIGQVEMMKGERQQNASPLARLYNN
jgi:hypothetical protein